MTRNEDTARKLGFIRCMLPSLAFAMVLGGCSAKGPEHSGTDQEDVEHHGTSAKHSSEEERVVRLDADVQKEFGVEVAVAGPGPIRRTVHLPGEVLANGDRLAHIVPRFDGVVTEVHGRIGDRVRKGDVLAIIESSESLAPFELQTLIDGVIIQKHITQGEAVTRDHETFVIADLQTVWVDLSVYQRDLSRVRIGQTVRIVTGEGGPEAEGTISYVTPVVDENTRTATARIVLRNSSGTWRPGMFVIGQVMVDEQKVSLVVPRTALQTIDDASVVFVATDKGFVPRPVTLGRLGETEVELLSGLDPGERYVTRGGFTLKAELAKSSFESGHAH
jgi:membrane fusion protein, heavy metal efflux system